ncbi:MAG: DegT/DnrJ/EryC1/StrS family aminotransferase, partial [Ignavibacteriaceae bacterium]|nr:DegT/DnrJ/EryC1/StrS family aminotransferase [Ignavibacteriaceae bacterium]
KYCIGTSSGTDGNHLALWSLDIKPGDEVIIPANTFIATAWGATLCGATPVLVDCHPESYNLDPDKVLKAINQKSKVIVAVHLYGQPADMGALRNISDEHRIHLVEDAAQAHLAEYKGKKVGGLSEVTSFSFYPGKNLGAYGEAGAVVTNDDKIANKIKKLREHGQSKKYYHETYGHNYRMEGIQGAVLGVKLKYIDKWTNERRRVAQKYREVLGNLERITLPKELSGNKHVYHLYVIRINTNNQQKNQKLRDNLQSYLQENKISTGLHYPVPLHLQDCFNHLGYKIGDFPETEKLAESCLSLPMFPELSENQIEFVAEKIKSFFKNN